MNKAFVRESDAPPPICPPPRGCGTRGAAVTAITVEAQIGAEAAAGFSSEVFYCATPGCAVGYFDAWGHVVDAAALATAAFPKHPEGPVCACLDIDARRFVEEARRGDKTSVRRALAHARGETAACETLAPDGQPCSRTARRLFLEQWRAQDRD